MTPQEVHVYLQFVISAQVPLSSFLLLLFFLSLISRICRRAPFPSLSQLSSKQALHAMEPLALGHA